MVAGLFVGCEDDDPPSDGLQFRNFQPADLVIGQQDFESGRPWGGGPIGASGLRQPYGSVAEGSLYVPDNASHRVLVYATPPDSNGAPADFVVGQEDLQSIDNSGGGPDRFYSAADCEVADGQLFVADLGGHRVLIWNDLPMGDEPADVVVGQPDFETLDADSTRSGFGEPIAIAVDDGRLFVSDYFNHRVLIWNTIPTSHGAPADVVVGQSDFVSNDPGLARNRLNFPRGVWAGGGKLVVCDTRNRRVLVWNEIPRVNGAPASFVLGAADFTTAEIQPPDVDNFRLPVDVASDGQNIFVSDGGFHRVLVFRFPKRNGTPAIRVLGQANFFNSAGDDLDQDGVPDALPSARTFGVGPYSPAGLSVIRDRLYVADQSNHRYLVFTGTR